MNKNIRVLLGLSSIISSSANAIVLTVDDDITGSTYLGNGSVTGTFDINSELISSDYTTPYDINSAYATFSFQDDAYDRDVYWYTGSTNYNYAYNSGSWNYYTRYEVDYFYDAYEQAGVNVSGYWSYDGTNWNSAVEGSTNTGNTLDGYSYPDAYYTLNYDSDLVGYTGSFSITQLLDFSGLSDLSSDGSIDYTAYASRGDLYLTEAELTVDVNANQIVASVPEPGIVALLASGLVAIGVVRRKPRG